MSIGFDPKNQKPAKQALSIENLFINGTDYPMYTTTVGTPIVTADPFLLTAGNYGILAATAITNSTGTTTVTGNLGESPGSTVTGAFTVSGSTDIDNAAAIQAQTDAHNGFTALQTLGLAGTVIPSELGGQTLNSPVAGATAAFQFASGSAGIGLTGTGTQTLTLNGPGRFVIYTASTLTTGASAGTAIPVIALTGGALARNVYFVVGSSATINQNTASIGATFNGNIIAQVSITTPQSTVMNGSFLALSGAVTLSNPATITAVSTSSSTATYNLLINVLEPVKAVYTASVKIDSSNTSYNLDQAHIAILDSKGALSGFNFNTRQWVSDQGVIELLGIPGTIFNPNDVASLKYRVQEDLNTPTPAN